MIKKIKPERLQQFYLAQEIFENCVATFENLDERSVWNIKNAFLFSFGVITTLGKFCFLKKNLKINK